MRKHIPRIEPFDFPAGEDRGGWFVGQEGVYLAVPGVQGFGVLTNHSIETNGEVNASVLITGTDGKGNPAEYHEFVILDGWPADKRKRAGEALPKSL